jgi:hypothetical protein
MISNPSNLLQIDEVDVNNIEAFKANFLTAKLFLIKIYL